MSEGTGVASRVGYLYLFQGGPYIDSSSRAVAHLDSLLKRGSRSAVLAVENQLSPQADGRHLWRMGAPTASSSTSAPLQHSLYCEEKIRAQS